MCRPGNASFNYSNQGVKISCVFAGETPCWGGFIPTLDMDVLECAGRPGRYEIFWGNACLGKKSTYLPVGATHVSPEKFGHSVTAIRM